MLKWNLRNDRIEGGQWIEARRPRRPLATFRRTANWSRASSPPTGAGPAPGRRSAGRPISPRSPSGRRATPGAAAGCSCSDQHFLLEHDDADALRHRRVQADARTSRCRKRFRVQPFDGHAPVPDMRHRAVRAWCCRAGASCSARVWGRATSDRETGLPFERRRSWRARSTIRSVRASSCAASSTATRRTAAGRVPHHARRSSRPRRPRPRAISAASTGSMPTTRATCCGARRGKLFRLAGPARRGMKIDAEPKLVADLNDMTFEAIEAPQARDEVAMSPRTGMRLADKIALVTGAGSGFGEGIARTFAREGAKVAVVDINEQAAQDVAAAIGNSAIAVHADVSQRADVEAAVQATVAGIRRARHPGQQCRRRAQARAARRGERGGVRPRARREHEVDLPVRARPRCRCCARAAAA